MDDRNALQPASEPRDTGSVVADSSGGWLSWLVLVLVATAALSLAAAHLPPVVKKLGLFAIGYGLVAGWMAAQLASRLGLAERTKGAWSVVVFLVVLAGQVGMAVQSQRILRTAEERRLAADPKSLLVLKMLETARVPADPSSQKAFADLRRTVGAENSSFAGYLQYRVSKIGVESRSGAAVIWLVEITLGSLSATWIFRRLTANGLRGLDCRNRYPEGNPGHSEETA